MGVGLYIKKIGLYIISGRKPERQLYIIDVGLYNDVGLYIKRGETRKRGQNLALFVFFISFGCGAPIFNA